MSETDCVDVCNSVMEKMCSGCKYHDVCLKRDESDGGMSDGETHDQMIECITNGFKPRDQPWRTPGGLYLGDAGLTTIVYVMIGKTVDELNWVLWDDPNRSLPVDYAPVINRDGKLADIVEIGHDESYLNHYGLTWDGYARAYRIVPKKEEP